MAQTTMYAGKTNSPKTSLVNDISANDTTIVIGDSALLPDAPNLAVIGETSEAEVIIYGGMSGNRLTGVLRGQGGTTARSWPAYTSVARNFTIIDYDNICNNIRDLETRKFNKADNLDLVTKVSGKLAVANGGTGVATVAEIKTLLGLAALAYKAIVNLGTDVTGTLAAGNGGTGQTSLQATRNAMGLGNTTGALPVANGGTGQTTVAAARNAFGLGNTTGALPIANGGTGQTTVAAARNALGLGNTTGALPAANGGTGQTSLQATRNAMGLGNTTGALPIANGGTGKTNITEARTALGITDIATRPNYQVSTANLTPGTSALATGSLYIVYE